MPCHNNDRNCRTDHDSREKKMRGYHATSKDMPLRVSAGANVALVRDDERIRTYPLDLLNYRCTSVISY